MVNKFSILSFLLLFCISVTAQVQLQGTVIGIDNTLVRDAYVVAYPQIDSLSPTFTNSDHKGMFTLKLKKEINYLLSITHIKYISYKDSLLLKTDLLNYTAILDTSIDELQEIVIKGRAPITVKKDTTTYDASAFSNGKENKLRELLKKLPGITIDREGNVEHKGEKVTQLLIDGKKFFFGDTKLGVNNIPANVADEIEVIKDYHETSFFKGLEKSEQIALNIKLKEDKKNFYFGEVEVGAGIEDRYVLNPTLFKYSDKLTINYIGDLNNTIEKSFTLKDYIRFTGASDLDGIKDVLTSSLSQSLIEQEFKDNRHLFSGFNSQYNPNKKSEFRISLIGLQDQTEQQDANVLRFLNENTIDSRLTNTENEIKNLFGLFEYNLKINPNTELRNKLKYEKTIFDYDSQTTSTFLNNGNPFKESVTGYNTSLLLESNFNKKFNKHHTTKITVKWKLDQVDEINSTLSETNVFADFIPVVNQQEYSVLQSNNTKSHKIGADFTHYWVLNRKNHLYIESSNNFTYQNFNSQAFQNIESNERFLFDGFNNDVRFLNFKSQSGFTYKRLFKNIIVESSLHFLHNTLSIDDINNASNLVNNKILPSVNAEWQLNKKNEISFKYTESADYVNFQKYTTGFQLNGFSSVFQGNQFLDIQESNKAEVNYSYGQTYGFNLRSTLSYKNVEPIIINRFEVDEIYRTSTPFQIDRSNSFYTAKLRLSYINPYWVIRFISSYRKSNLTTIIDSTTLPTTGNIVDNALTASTSFKDVPNIDTEIRYLIYNNKINDFENTQQNFSINTTLNYDYEDWKLNLTYDFTTFRSNNDSNRTSSFFDNLSSQIIYQKEDSLWAFKLKIYNLTNNKEFINTSFDTTFISEISNAVFPRYALFSVSYKL